MRPLPTLPTFKQQPHNDICLRFFCAEALREVCEIPSMSLVSERLGRSTGGTFKKEDLEKEKVDLEMIGLGMIYHKGSVQ